jgi:hypothetical protein
MVVYYHATLFGKEDVPTLNGDQIQAIAGLYTSQQYAIMFPNYIGYNVESNSPHPYLFYYGQNIKSAILALNTLELKLYMRYRAIKYNLFSVGYS